MLTGNIDGEAVQWFIETGHLELTATQGTTKTTNVPYDPNLLEAAQEQLNGRS